MPKYNTKFELSLEDMELIETALQQVQKADPAVRPEVRQVHDLLGRLHNQKIFYRPARHYVGG